jgi:hypothetical protein
VPGRVNEDRDLGGGELSGEGSGGKSRPRKDRAPEQRLRDFNSIICAKLKFDFEYIFF